MFPLQPAPRAELTIQESADGVQFHVRQEQAPFLVAWRFAFAFFLLWFVTGVVSDRWSWQRVVLVVAGGFCGGTWMSRPRVVTTTFGRKGVGIKGWLQSGASSPRWTPLQEISELLWQPKWESGPDSSTVPAGLYARRGLTLVCLVPYIDAAQARRAMQAIEQQFSWVDRENSGGNSLLFTDDLVRLGLDTRS